VQLERAGMRLAALLNRHLADLPASAAKPFPARI
jgi:hypothetical protein